MVSRRQQAIARLGHCRVQYQKRGSGNTAIPVIAINRSHMGDITVKIAYTSLETEEQRTLLLRATADLGTSWSNIATISQVVIKWRTPAAEFQSGFGIFGY